MILFRNDKLSYVTLFDCVIIKLKSDKMQSQLVQEKIKSMVQKRRVMSKGTPATLKRLKSNY